MPNPSGKLEAELDKSKGKVIKKIYQNSKKKNNVYIDFLNV